MATAVLITPDQRHHLIDGVQFNIGSDLSCNLVLNSENIMAIHAKLQRKDRDTHTLKPSSGALVSVNGRIVSGTATLHTGDKITIGDIELHYRFEDAIYIQDAVVDNIPAHANDEDIVEAEFEEISDPMPKSETGLIVKPIASLVIGEEVRLGCAYCFRTLNPEDVDDALRPAVRFDRKHYHQKCWVSSPSHEQSVELFTPPVPPPLKVPTLVGAPLYTGTLNSLDDIPLGISESVIVLNSTDPFNMTLRNNSEAPLIIDRLNMPLWALIDYGIFGTTNERKLLMPGESLQVNIYPHLVRPDLETYYLAFNDRQGMHIESQSVGIIPVSVLVGIYGLYLVHIFALLNMRYWLYYWDSYALISFQFLLVPLLILIVLFGVLALLSPAVTLWQIYSIAMWFEQSPAGSLCSPILNRLKISILNQFQYGSIRSVMKRWTTPLSLVLVGVSALAALTLWLSLLLLTAIFVGSLSDLFFLAELGLILFLLYRFGKGYGFNLVTFTQSLFRLGQSAYRAASASQRSPGGAEQ